MFKKVNQVIKFLPWWFWFCIINLLLVVSTITHHTFKFNRIIHFFLRQIDLAIEMNFAAWWSGVLLLMLGLLAYEIFCHRNEQSKIAWLFLSIAWTCLSLDEIGSIHERIEDWLPENWLGIVDPYVPVAILGILLVPYPLIKLFQRIETRKTAILLLSGFLLWASIAVQERIEGYIDWGDWWAIRLGIEEGTELLGMFLCYCGLVNHTWRGDRVKSLSGVIPNPLRMNYIPMIVWSGLIIHLAITFLLVISTEAPFSEHTLVWYPLALSLMLSLAAFWQYKCPSDRLYDYPRQKGWLILSVYLLAYSAVIPYAIPLATNKADAYLSSDLHFFYIVQLILVSILFISFQRDFPKRYSTISAVGFIVILSGISPQSMAVRYALPGFFTFLLFRLFFLDSFIQKQAMEQLGQSTT